MPRIDAVLNKVLKKTNALSIARELIYNKYVLYAVFLAALFDLLYSIVKEDYLHCVLFILIGFLIAFFNKNMTVILTLTIAISTVIGNIIRGNKLKVEGFDDSTEKNADESSESNANPLSKLLGNNSKDEKDTKISTSLPSTDNANKTPKSDAQKPDAQKSDAQKPDTKNSDTKKSDAQKPDKAQLMEDLKEKALDLQETQQNIIQGFEKIEPYMDQAESIINSIQQTAQTIQGMRGMNK